MKSLLILIQYVIVAAVITAVLVFAFGTTLVRGLMLGAVALGLILRSVSSSIEARSQRSGGRAARAEHEEMATVLA